jgi:hypothetical protein
MALREACVAMRFVRLWFSPAARKGRGATRRPNLEPASGWEAVRVEGQNEPAYSCTV